MMATEPAKLAEVNVDDVLGRVRDELFLTHKRVTEKVEMLSEQIGYWQAQLNKLDRFMASNLLTEDDPVSTEMNQPVSNEHVLAEVKNRYNKIHGW